MRSIFWISLFLGVEVFYGNAQEKTPAPGKSLFDAFSDVFLHNFDKEKLVADIIHFVKAFGGKKILEDYYKLPKEQRQCILDEKTKLFNEILHGKFTSPDKILQRFKKACPKTADGIQKVYDQLIPYMKEQMEKLYKLVSTVAEQKLPESVTKGLKEEATSWVENFDFSEFLKNTNKKEEL